MNARVLSLRQAAAHVRLPEHELLHLAQRGEVESIRRGEDFYFEHEKLDEWAQLHILEIPGRELSAMHRTGTAAVTRRAAEDSLVPRLFKPEWISLEMVSKTRPSVIRDMVALASSTGLLYDDAAFSAQVSAREQSGSTAVEGGLAFLHARRHDPYCASESFCVLGRLLNPVSFGMEDGSQTDLFFLLCCTDDELHLHLLARLAMMARQLGFPDALRAAETPADAFAVLAEGERQVLEAL